MNQQTELSRVKARIKALAEKTVSNGCTEAEAMAAAEMVGRLLERYALTMEEIDLREAQCVQVEIPLTGRQRRPIDGCVPAIARCCDCKVWLVRQEKGSHYVFFGFETDTALAAYLYQVIDRAILSELAGFRAVRQALRGTDLRRSSISFQQGMASRLAERLETLHADREANVAAQRAVGTALMIVKHLVVEEAFKETTMRLVSARRSGMRLNGAFREGYAAGDQVNLSRPLRGQGRDSLR